MSSDQLSVAVTRRLPDAVEARLSELFDVKLRDNDEPMARAELVEAVKAVDVLVPTVTDRIDAALLAQAGPRLKLLANFGAGIDHIDVDTARQRGILVSNTPGVLTDDTADMVMALMLLPSASLAEEVEQAPWEPEAAAYRLTLFLGNLSPVPWQKIKDNWEKPANGAAADVAAPGSGR